MSITTIQKRLSSTLSALVGIALFLIITVTQHVAQNPQRPSPVGHVNDFARVIDEPTRIRLENVLQNLKQKAKVDFYVATVEATNGVDIFDYSRQLATDWNVGARNSTSKSLLLVVSVENKSSFTQFSRVMQADLPDGVLGAMSLRMRSPLSAGRFAEAIDSGVQHFVGSVAQRMGFDVQELDRPIATAAATSVSETQPQPVPVSSTDPAASRPRVVSEAQTPAENQTPSTAQNEERPTETPTTSPVETKKPETKAKATKAPSRPPQQTQTSTTAESTIDEDESEEVELTLTLPLAKRADKLKTFIETHPNSKAKPRAIELLISTHAGLGDQFLKNGDIENGVKQLQLAIAEAEPNISDQLFSGVIGQIPSNLYLRNQTIAALDAAKSIETKFGNDPKRLLIVAGFYLGIELGDEAARVASLAVKLAPDMAEAHRVLALGLHVDLRLEEAAEEYKKTIELDPTSKLSKSSLADLTRASGKPEEALALYNELLKADPKDRNATAGMVLSLFELGRKEEANAALEAAIAAEPRNLALLSGTAYWMAAHENYEKAVELARRAIEIEPRYTWSHIALVRSLLGLKKPIGAERTMRFAKQYGKFPTLTYELANVLASMGFYDEAAETLKESFSLEEDRIATNMAGRIPATDPSFLSLLSHERRASIYQVTAADTASNAKMLRDLLALATALTPAPDGKLNEEKISAAAREFGSGTDAMKTYRQVYAASRLLRHNVALSTALELAQEAKKGVDAALDLVVATSAVQADEYRDMRAQALANGKIPDIADAQRSVLSGILRGRIEDITGWILFNQDKTTEAVEYLKRASTILPSGTPAWRNAMWHLGVAFEQAGNNNEALESYIQSYNTGVKDPNRRTTIERLYRKINGNLYGLDDRIGAAALSSGASTTGDKPAGSSATSTSSPETGSATPTSTLEKTPTPETPTSEAPKVEPTPSPTPTETQPSTPQPEPISEEALKAAGSRLRSNIKITGRVLDASRNGIANVVVVLISPSGSVLASTTDNEGNYTFTVMPSPKTYRVIPSKDGYTFSPVDKTFVGLIDDQRGINFIGTGP